MFSPTRVRFVVFLGALSHHAFPSGETRGVCPSQRPARLPSVAAPFSGSLPAAQTSKQGTRCQHHAVHVTKIPQGAGDCRWECCSPGECFEAFEPACVLDHARWSRCDLVLLLTRFAGKKVDENNPPRRRALDITHFLEDKIPSTNRGEQDEVLENIEKCRRVAGAPHGVCFVRCDQNVGVHRLISPPFGEQQRMHYGSISATSWCLLRRRGE